jgi:hypothetical protein
MMERRLLLLLALVLLLTIFLEEREPAHFFHIS